MRAKTISRILSAAVSAAMVVTSLPAAALAAPADSPKAAEGEQNLLKLWYDEPASMGENILSAGSYNPSEEDNNWQQHTLPIGNSFMGANVYGEIARERLTFNQKTLWNGGPSTRRPDYDGGNIDKASQWQESVTAFLAGDEQRGSDLAGGLVGEGESAGYGVYQSWGDIYLDYKNLADVAFESTEGYERNLDLTTGIANVDFTAGGTAYHREYFISYPDNVLAMRLTADGGSGMDLNVSFPIDNGEVGEMQGNITSIQDNKNRNLAKENETYTVTASAKEGTIVSAANMQDNQMKMNSVMTVKTDAGTVAKNADNASLDISGAKEITIFVSANTDYKNEYPKYRTGETDEQLAKRVKDTVDNAVAKGYETVKSRYLADYQELFGRVDLDLGQQASDKTTDQLLAAYKSSGESGATDSERRLLEVLLYQYGRYLTIASSRDGDLPSTLQGVWQNRVGTSGRVPWGSDFHMNVNLQMNYWPTYSANLAECATPIVDYVNSLREPGRVTAENYFGIVSGPGEANGFSAHTQNSPFGWTCPGWSFNWGWSPAAVPWIIQNCWEHYEYTGDKEYMRTHLYPMMKEETLLYDQILVDSGREITLSDGSKSTRLVSAPAYSSEHGPRTLGNVYENVLIWQLYEDTITAAETLGVDSDLVARWKETKERLSPIEVGDSGQIKEWYHEGAYNKTEAGETIGEDGHRHMSHMLGLFPGDLISVDNDEYMDAAVVTLDKRGYNSTGWGMGQRINAWARTGKGNTAYRLVQNLFKGGIYPNLWDSHAPFQIDGNFGYTSGVDEMLMQSNVGYINILPAIPDAWASGSVNGIVARDNFELGIDWADGAATEIRILSKNGNECVVQHPGIGTATIKDSKGRAVKFETVEGRENRISFATRKGETYTITNMFGAPQNVKASKKSGGVEITWDALAGADSYNVYANESGSFKKLNANAVTGTSFTDSTIYKDVYEVEFVVAAVKGGKEGKRSDKVKLTATIELINESDSRISYTNGTSGINDTTWRYHGDSGHYGGGIQFIERADGTEAVELPFNGTGIEIIARKNNGRYAKQWKVYIDGAEAGVADCNGSGEYRQPVYTNYDLTKGQHTIKLTTEGNAEGKIELDAFIVYSEKDPDISVTYSLGDKEGTAPTPSTGKFREAIQLKTCDIEGFEGWSDGSATYKAGSNYTLSYRDVALTAVFLEKDPSQEYFPLSKSGWTATAGSEENSGNDGPASSAIDGDESTYWHSNYSDDAKKPTISDDGTRNEFTIDFGKAVSIDKFEYVPRNNNQANGFITKYKLLTSASESGDFTEVKTGTWENNTEKKEIRFDSTLTNVRRIQIKALETKNAPGGEAGGNKYIHAAEFNVYEKNPDYVPQPEPEAPTGVTVESATMTLNPGESKNVGAKVTPDGAEQKLIYSSNDITVAYVSPNGLVTASNYKSGTATITVKSAVNTRFTKTVEVKVNEPAEVEVESISLEKERVILKAGEKTAVAASIEPYFGTDKTVTWSSSDPSKVTVENGEITAVAAGEAVITAAAKNGKTATCTVVVTDQAALADNRELNSLVSKVESENKGKDLNLYDPDLVQDYTKALEEAKTVLSHGSNVLQSEVDAVMSKLQEAASALASSAPDPKNALKKEINDAKNKDLSSYPKKLQDAYKQAIADAEKILNKEGVTQDEIEKAIDDLQKAAEDLEEGGGEPDGTDKSVLKAEIDAATAKGLTSYTPNSITVYKKAIADAQKVYNSADATQEQIDQAVKDLKAAAGKLVGKANFTALNAAITAAASVKLTDYSSETVSAFNKRLSEAKSVAANQNATQAQVDAARKNLVAAQSALKLAIPTGTIVQGDFEYKVTKSDAVNGTVSVSKLTSAGKKKTSLTIPPTIVENGYTFKVTEIGNNLCAKSKKLKSVVIGANITKIGKKSFYNCKKLGSITFKCAKVPKFGTQAFKGTKKNPKIFYPSKMKKKLSNLKKTMKKAGIKASNKCYKKKG